MTAPRQRALFGILLFGKGWFPYGVFRDEDGGFMSWEDHHVHLGFKGEGETGALLGRGCCFALYDMVAK